MPSAEDTKRSVDVFLSYSHVDDRLRDQLEKHLSILRRIGLINAWYDRDIQAGKDWQYEINQHLARAQIILLLISSDFMASDYCYSNEMMQALQRHNKGEAYVIPIILRPVDWRDTPLDKLQALPKNAQPITTWTSMDEAFYDVARGIRTVIESLLEKKLLSKIDALTDLTETSPHAPPGNLPRHNPFFTGREEILERLYESLIKGKIHTSTPTNLQALVGVDGVGKTQIAIEYAYRYSRNYQIILWVKANTYIELIADFVAIAHMLDLPEKNIQDQNRTVAAVKNWMGEHSDWLLIIDNADDIGMIADFIPFTNKGHILITTRAKYIGNITQQVKVDRMDTKEAAHFLLRRSKIIENSTQLTLTSVKEHSDALRVADALRGYPLALDLAGSYIERAKCSLSDYLGRYLTHQVKLQVQYEKPTSEFFEIAAKAWDLLFEDAKKTSPDIIEPWYFCAFLQTSYIPEELIIKEFPDINWTFQSFSNAALRLDSLEEPPKSSLKEVYSNFKTFSLHPLIPVLIKNRLNKKKQQFLAERVVKAVNRLFPEVGPSTWNLCQRYIMQAQISAYYIKDWNIESQEAIALLHRTAYYLKERGHYSQAELLITQALEIQIKTLGANHFNVAQSLNDLAEIYHTQGKYALAGSSYQQALTIKKRALGPNAAEVAQILNSLAVLYNDQGMYSKAEMYFKQALNIRRSVLGTDHLDVSQSMNNLALLYSTLGKYEEAELLLEKALMIRKRLLGLHPDVATSLNNLATIYSDRGEYFKAEKLLNEALAIDEQIYGQNHPNVARDFNNLGSILEAQDDLLNAQMHYEQALKIDQMAYGFDHPNVAGDINNLGSINRKLANLKEAQILFEKALSIDQKVYGLDHPNLATRLNNLGSVIQEQGKIEEALELYSQALEIIEATYGQNSPKAASILNNLASVYQAQGNLPKAQSFYEKALTTVQATYGPDHINVGHIVNNLGNVLQEMGDVESARVYYEQALRIFQEHLGMKHPYINRITENLSRISKIGGEYK